MGDRGRPADRLAFPGRSPLRRSSTLNTGERWRVLGPASRRTALCAFAEARRLLAIAVALRRRETSPNATRGRNPVPAARADLRQPQRPADLMSTYASKIVRVPAATSSEQSRLRLSSHRSGPSSSIASKRRSRVQRGSKDRGLRRFKGREARWLALTPSCSWRSRTARPSARTWSRSWPARRSSCSSPSRGCGPRSGGAWRTDGAQWWISCAADSAPTRTPCSRGRSPTACGANRPKNRPSACGGRSPACPAERASPNLTCWRSGSPARTSPRCLFRWQQTPPPVGKPAGRPRSHRPNSPRNSARLSASWLPTHTRSSGQ